MTADVAKPESPTRVNVVGGSELTRELFAHLLIEAGFEVANDPQVISENEVALVVVENDDPLRLLAETAHRRAIVVSDTIDEQMIADLVLDGADAVVGLEATSQELTDAVRLVATGGTVVPPLAARRVTELARVSRASTAPNRSLLTSREIDILVSIGQGETVKQTAQSLGITAKTVENLQSKLFRKLDVRNRAQAFARAHSLGLLPPTVRDVDTSPA